MYFICKAGDKTQFIIADDEKIAIKCFYLKHGTEPTLVKSVSEQHFRVISKKPKLIGFI